MARQAQRVTAGANGTNGTNGTDGATGATGAQGPFVIQYLGGSAGTGLRRRQYRVLLAGSSAYPTNATTNGNATVQAGGAATLSRFTVTLSGNPSSGDSYAFTVMVNGSATAISCTITETAPFSCTDSDTVALTVGQTVNVRIVPASSPDVQTATWTAIYTSGSQPIQ